MNQPKDILNIEDIRLLVDTFYEKVRKDELLSPVFNAVIKDNWPAHLEKMYRFWQTVLLGEHTYFGSPFQPHVKLPIEKIHFERWLKLFFQNIDEQFEGEKAEEAKTRSFKMAEMFQYKLAYYKNNAASPLL